LTGENAAVNIATRRDLLYKLIIAMVLLTFLRTLTVYLVCMDVEFVSQKVLYRIRTYLFEKIECQDMKFYSTFRTGDLMTRLTGDLDAVRHMIAWVIRTIVESVSLFSAAAIYFFYMDWLLALCVLAIAPFILVIIIIFKNKVAPKHKALREKLSQMNTAAQENISGNRVVKAFAREDYEIERFNDCNTAYSQANRETAFEWLKFYPYVESFANLMPVVLLAVGGVFIIQSRITMGEYVAFSGLIWAITNPMRQLGNVMNEFQRFSAAADKVMEIYYSEPEIVDKPDAIDRPEHFEGKVEFRNVSFQYEDGNLPVLHNISFVANPGETVAIMGETGCGKTSLIQLIPRFYEPTEGEVLVDDINVQDMKLTQLRKNIGLATQDVLLYSDTIDGNIAYGDSHIKQEEVVKFARYSAASEFIAKMPEGYDTIVGERGVGLSGGQKQRISLARALAVKPSILILDDTTSAVDMETEKKIQHSLNELDFPCTKIIIAQRISTTKFADKILVLQDGHISECGTHDELVAKKGYYYSLVKLQTGEDNVN
jgi:ATP-binding cassette subfamily B protein